MKFIRSHANIALIKYWGKANEQKVLPFNSSISLTLEAFFTETVVLPCERLQKDLFFLNGKLQNETQTEKVAQILDGFRPERKAPHFCIIVSHNSMPTAAGLSSSSSGISALVLAADQAFPQKPARNLETLTTHARLGSGSSCRSFYAPFALWKEDGSVEPLACPLDLAMCVLILEDQEKDISSRLGMKHTVETSTRFEAFTRQARQDALAMVQAMQKGDFQTMGRLMESNTLLMHETTRYAQPGFSYLTQATWDTLKALKTLRQNLDFQFYFTMDAGPNIKLLCLRQDLERLHERIKQHFPNLKTVASPAAKKPFEICEKPLPFLIERVPAKLFLMGEYAVTQAHHRAIVLSIPKYTTAFCMPLKEGQATSLSSSLFSKEEAPNKMALLYKAIGFIEQDLQKNGIQPRPYAIHLETELYTFSQTGNAQKLGLGSSASVLVLLFKTLWKLHGFTLEKEVLFKKVALFCLKEKLSGSYADLACCAFEQHILYQNFERPDASNLNDSDEHSFKGLSIQPIALPPTWQGLAYFSQASASTEKLLEKTRIPQAFYEKSEALLDAFLKKPALEQLEQAKSLLQTLEDLSERELETQALKTICAFAQMPHSASKWSGAGGGDCALIFSDQSDEIERIKRTCPYPLVFEFKKER